MTETLGDQRPPFRIKGLAHATGTAILKQE